MGNQGKQKAVDPVFKMNEKGYVEAMVNEGGVPRNMVKAYLQQASGKKTFEEARDANGLPENMTPVALASKINTGFKRVLRSTIFAETIANEQAKANAKAQKEQDAKIAKWEKTRRGRPPVGCGRSADEMNAELAIKTAHQKTRAALGIGNKGRIAAELQEDYDREFYKVHLPANIAYYAKEAEIDEKVLIAQLSDEDQELLASHKKSRKKIQKPVDKAQKPVEVENTEEVIETTAEVEDEVEVEATADDEVPFEDDETAEAPTPALADA